MIRKRHEGQLGSDSGRITCRVKGANRIKEPGGSKSGCNGSLRTRDRMQGVSKVWGRNKRKRA